VNDRIRFHTARDAERPIPVVSGHRVNEPAHFDRFGRAVMSRSCTG